MPSRRIYRHGLAHLKYQRMAVAGQAHWQTRVLPIRTALTMVGMILGPKATEFIAVGWAMIYALLCADQARLITGMAWRLSAVFAALRCNLSAKFIPPER